MKQIDFDSLRNGIKTATSEAIKSDDLDDLITSYNRELGRLLDEHAPEQSRIISERKPNFLTTDDIREEKQIRRRLEKKAKRTKLEVDKQAFKDQKNKVNKLLDAKKQENLSKLIDSNKDNARDLFRVINSTLHRKQESPLPPHSSEEDLANEFGEFFNGKISKIRDNLDNTTDKL